jgi:hypothetical protein
MGLVSVITLLNLPINFLMEYCDGKYRQSIQMMTCHFNDGITGKIFFYFLIIFIFLLIPSVITLEITDINILSLLSLKSIDGNYFVNNYIAIW